MDLYNFTGWGFFVTVVSILITGSYIRQSLIGLAGAIDQRFKDLESKLEDMQKDVVRIDRKIPKPFDPWSDLSSQ
jgi:hypothetical protein